MPRRNSSSNGSATAAAVLDSPMPTLTPTTPNPIRNKTDLANALQRGLALRKLISSAASKFWKANAKSSPVIPQTDTLYAESTALFHNLLTSRANFIGTDGNQINARTVLEVIWSTESKTDRLNTLKREFGIA
jgi:hypothetical protein